MATEFDMVSAVLGGRGRIAILRLLSSQTAPLTGRQVAELTGLSVPGAARALDHLASLGVVSRRRAGTAYLHELHRDNILVQTIVLPVFEAESSIRSDLEHELDRAFGSVAVSIVLFGSVVRGEAEPGSDIDVLVVTANHRDADSAYAVADDIGPRFFRRFGMPLSVIVSTRRAVTKQPSPFLAAVRDEGVLVKGTPLAELMEHHV